MSVERLHFMVPEPRMASSLGGARPTPFLDKLRRLEFMAAAAAAVVAAALASADKPFDTNDDATDPAVCVASGLAAVDAAALAAATSSDRLRRLCRRLCFSPPVPASGAPESASLDLRLRRRCRLRPSFLSFFGDVEAGTAGDRAPSGAVRSTSAKTGSSTGSSGLIRLGHAHLSGCHRKPRAHAHRLRSRPLGTGTLLRALSTTGLSSGLKSSVSCTSIADGAEARQFV
jgi:hypothetical protein